MANNYNFNINPYYDDFDETKGYHRILFRPGYAVQARELTQIQSQLQNQITKFGDHIFKDGSLVLGGNFITSDVLYIRVTSEDINEFEGKIFDVVDIDSPADVIRAKARVISIKLENKVNQNDPDVWRIFFSYLNGGVIGRANTLKVENLDLFAEVVDEENFGGTGTSFSIDESVFYVSGFFVYCEPQTEIISQDGPSTCRVGLFVSQGVIDSSQDSSLLDPALGSYNYTAPGADRFYVKLQLTSFEFNPEDLAAEENASPSFIEIARFVNGSLVNLNRFPIYSEIENTFARRTYDESGDYTVRSFGLKVQDHIYSNNSLLSLKVDPGKAYVKGYEFETIAPTYVDLPKSRAIDFENEFPLFVNYGKYIYVEDVSGDADFTNNFSIVFRDSSDNSLGSATVKYIKYNSQVSNKNVYKLYIDNLQDVSGISNAVKVDGQGDVFSANISSNTYGTSSISIVGSTNPSYLVKIPKNYVQSVNVAETSFTTIKSESINFSANVALVDLTFPALGAGTLSSSEILQNFFIATSTGTVLTPATGLTIQITDGGYRVNITYPNLSSIARLTYRTNIVAAQRTKTLVNSYKIIDASDVLNQTVISLEKSDCYRLTSIVAVDDSSNEYDYTSSYEFNTGQTDTLYDHGSIRLRDGYLDPVRDNVASIQSINVRFSYFTHNGDGFFSVNSYGGSFPYEDIPKYTSSTGEVFDLKNCLDFRPRRNDDDITIDNNYLAEPISQIITDLNYYLGRIDKLVLTKERKLALIQGIPAVNPSVPSDLNDCMTLYVIKVAPYTANKDEVSTTFVENKRYTMRDIGKIEKRVEKLEYYTSLSLLEKQARDESIPSDVDMIDRFKNGILVDSFAGHSVGDVRNRDYRCSIDYKNRILRPPFASDSFTFKVAGESSINTFVQKGDLLLLPYTTEVFLNQPLASTSVNLNPFNVFAWNGSMDLDPPSDNWIDTYQNPDVVVNLNGENDVYTILVDEVENPTSIGVRWTDWQTIVNGVPQETNTLVSTDRNVTTQTVDGRIIETTTVTTTTDQTTTVTDELLRTGIEISTGSVQTITKDLGTKVVDTSIIPYVRSRLVKFYSRSMKPSTELFATFDGVDVTDYCTPATEVIVNTSISLVDQNAASFIITSKGLSGEVIFKRKDRVFIRVTPTVYNDPNTAPTIVNVAAGDVMQWVNKDGISLTTSSTVSQVVNRTTLRTNEKGDIAGVFWIPNFENIRFRTGERVFRLADTIGQGSTTASATKYVAQGLSQSLERTLVATRVSTVSIDPVMETQTITDRTTRTIVGSTSTTRDITPPPPPPPPPPPTLECGFSVNGARIGKFTYLIQFGTGTGLAGIRYNDASIPSRYTLIWDGNEYSSGFVGNKDYDKNLQANGFPNSVNNVGFLLFNKTKANPTTAILVADAPLTATTWRFAIVCPGEYVPPPPPVTPPQIDVKLSVPRTYVFAATNNSTTQNLTCSLSVASTTPRTNWTRVVLTANNNGVINPGGSAVVVMRNDEVRNFTLRVTSPTPGNFRDVTVTAECRDYATQTEANNGGSSALNQTVQAVCRVSKEVASAPVDPVAQTFFVNADLYPNGLFLDSIDLFFKKKSNNMPVTLELRPTVNGYPSSKDIVPFGVVNLLPEDINLWTDVNTNPVSTRFSFPSPVYLPPGEHSFVVKTNTDEYEIYSAILGQFLINNPDIRITEQPSTGSVFKSQNATTWTAMQEEDLMFRINKCVFPTDVISNIILNTDYMTIGTTEYDVFFADGEVLDFAATNIDYYFKNTFLNDTTNSFDSNRYQLGSNVTLSSRAKVSIGSDLQKRIFMSTIDRNVSPVIDLSRLSCVLVRNTINNAGLSPDNFIITNYGSGYTSNATITITGANTSPASARAVYDTTNSRLRIVVDNPGAGYTGNITATITGGGGAGANVTVLSETGLYGGPAVAKYITRKVTLAPEFESEDLRVFFLANIPSGTGVKVYYKVAPVTNEFFNLEPWREMSLVATGSFSETGFAEYKYKTPNDTALPSGDKFKTFAIKIIMLSNNTTKVPQIRDLRVIALDE